MNVRNEASGKVGFLKRFLPGRVDTITRDYRSFGGVPFDIITLSQGDLDSEPVKHLLNVSRGKVLESTDAELNSILKDFLFDKTPYMKRALLSAVNGFIKETGDRLSVAVSDASFVMCEEYVILASLVRALSIVTESGDINGFADKCYYDYGLKIQARRCGLCNACDLILDFAMMKKDGSVEIMYKGERYPVYPDNKYFEPDNEILSLMAQGVPVRCACAVLKGGNYLS